MVVKQFQIHSYAICSILEVLLTTVDIHSWWVSTVMVSCFSSESMVEGQRAHTHTHTNPQTFCASDMKKKFEEIFGFKIFVS